MDERPAFCRLPGFLTRVSPSRRACSSSGFLSLPRQGRTRPFPRCLVGARAKFETQALSSKWRRLFISGTTRAFILAVYPICKSLIFWRLHAIPLLSFQRFMLSNTYLEYGCMLCKPSCSYHARQSFRRETFPLHSGSSCCRPWSK